jgi:conjugal transfer mating pair stabilization protein TraG
MSEELFVVYTYGAGEVLENTFNAIASMYTGGYMSQLFNLSVMIGLAWAGIRAGVTRNHASHYMKWFGGYIFVILILLQPVEMFKNKGMTMYINDVVTGKRYNVDHLPPGLVIPAGFISSVGYSMTKLFETLFAAPMPEYLPYHKYGTTFASQVRADMKKMTIQDPILQENLEGYITKCMLYDTLIGMKYNINDLMNSGNIWQLLEEKSSNLRMFNYRKDGHEGRELVACKVGLKRLASSFNGEAELLAKKFPALSKLMTAREQSDQNAKNGFIKALELTDNFYGNVNGSASEQLKQILIINQFKTVPHTYGMARGLQNQNTGWKIIGDIGQLSLPILHSIFQALIYACFPIVVTILFFSQRYQSLKTYFELMVWIELWPLLFAILNGAVSIFARRAGLDESITINSMDSIASTQSTYAMMAYGMGLSIPSFAYMISKGGVGQFVHMAGSLMAGTQRGADMAATEIATGNRSLDNVSTGNKSFNNVSGNKYDTTGSYQMGFVRSTDSSGIKWRDNLADGDADSSGRIIEGQGKGHDKHNSELLMDAISSNINSDQMAYANSQSIIKTESEQAMESKQSAIRHATDFLAKNARAITKGEGFSLDMSSKEDKSLYEAAKQTETIAQKNGYNWTQAASTALSAALGFSAGGRATVGGNANGSLSASSTDEQSVSEGTDYTFSKDAQKIITSMISHGKHKKYDENNTEEKAITDNLSHSYDENKQHSRTIALQEARSENLSQSISNMNSFGITTSQDVAHKFLERLSRSLVDPKEGNAQYGVLGAVRAVARRDPHAMAKLEQYKQEMTGAPEQFVRIPKTLDNSTFGGDAKKQIQASIPENNIQAISDESKNKNASNSNTDGTDIINQVNNKINETKNIGDDQRVKNGKGAQDVKDEVNEADGTVIMGTLRDLGWIGKKNPNKNKRYDENN